MIGVYRTGQGDPGSVAETGALPWRPYDPRCHMLTPRLLSPGSWMSTAAQLSGHRLDEQRWTLCGPRWRCLKILPGLRLGDWGVEMNERRELDVVVFGATGFVGRLVAAYVAAAAPAQMRIGLGGRSAGRLEAVRDGLGAAAAGWPLRSGPATRGWPRTSASPATPTRRPRSTGRPSAGSTSTRCSRRSASGWPASPGTPRTSTSYWRRLPRATRR